jgi:nitrate reductase gamma subunit
MCFLHSLRLIKLGAPKDLSENRGSVSAGIVYSNLGAMLPNKKGSAYLHIPTFTAGVFFHIGTFLAFLCFFILISDIIQVFFCSYQLMSVLIAFCLWGGSCFGVGLLIKRLVSKQLRPISNIDDYLSVFFTALFQIFSALLFTTFAFPNIFSSNIKFIIICAYYFVSALLFLYLPFGKLKHVVYYFAARYHLGFFYGRRGTWPPKKD